MLNDLYYHEKKKMVLTIILKGRSVGADVESLSWDPHAEHSFVRGLCFYQFLFDSIQVVYIDWSTTTSSHFWELSRTSMWDRVLLLCFCLHIQVSLDNGMVSGFDTRASSSKLSFDPKGKLRPITLYLQFPRNVESTRSRTDQPDRES